MDFDSFTAHYRQNLVFHKKKYGFSFDWKKELKELRRALPIILPLIKDTSLVLHDTVEKEKKILLEGANGTLLDIDHGTFPYVTSSNASIGGIITGSGIPPGSINDVVAIMKAYRRTDGQLS